MGLFSGQLANVVEWEEYRDDILFWKWSNSEIKKGSKLILRKGQDAIFMFNGKVEGVFKDEGEYDIETQIVPFLSTLKGFKFGFNSGMRAEVLFINTKEYPMNWGTAKPIRVQAPGLPGGLPIRSNGSFVVAVDDYDVLIDKVAGVKKQYAFSEVRERIMAELNPNLIKWITNVGQDVFNLQANITEIQKGMTEDLDMNLRSIGLKMVQFRINEFSYPENIEKRADQAAEHSMIGDMNRFQQVSMVDSMTNAGSGGINNQAAQMANNMIGMQMGMMMGQQMMNNMQMGMQPQMGQPMQQPQMQQPIQGTGGEVPKFCPNCGNPTNGARFCGNCGTKLA